MSKYIITPECYYCGQRYQVDPKDSLPIMVGFELDDGKVINACRHCLIKLGEEKNENSES